MGKDRGATLVELMMAIAATSLIALICAVFMQITVQSKTQAFGHGDLLESTGLLRMAINRHAAGGLNCADVFSFTSGQTFNANGETPLIITLPPDILKDGGLVTGLPGFRVDKIYLTNSSLISGNDIQKNYISNLYIEASVRSGSVQVWKALRRRPILTMNLVVDNAGHLVSCNSSAQVIDPQIVCQSLQGMIWDPNLSACLENVPFPTVCSGGAVMGSDGQCHASASQCNTGLIAQSFDHGIVSSCAPAPSSDFVATPAAPTTPVGVAAPTTCNCGGTQIGLGSYCSACDHGNPTLTFQATTYTYQIYICDPGSGNLIFQRTENTMSAPSTCNTQLRPANCGSGSPSCPQN